MTRIEVTAEDIRDGRRVDCRECPVARAVNRVVRDAASVAVTHDCVGLFLPGDIVDVLLPYEITRFIENFDARRHVEPIAFDLDIPARFLPETPPVGGPTGP